MSEFIIIEFKIHSLLFYLYSLLYHMGSSKSKQSNTQQSQKQQPIQIQQQVNNYDDVEIQSNTITQQVNNYDVNIQSNTITQQVNNYANYDVEINTPNSKCQLLLLNKQDDLFKKAKTVAIVVSFRNDSTYDSLFTQIQQKSQAGTKTLVYSGSGNSVQLILDAFNQKGTDPVAIELVKQIKLLDPDCTVFNWECCSGYAQKTFPQGKDLVMSFVEFIIKRGHMAMFSDFSLKSLINNWDEKILGPNPFIFQNEFSGNIVLEFEPSTLKQCPSTQLQSVGELSQGGKCNVHALGGTIGYSINHKKTDTQKYKIQILSVATNLKPNRQENLCKIKQLKGLAGHVLINYPSGGKILTSMGHWIQLMKIDTSQKKIFEVARENYGQAEVDNIQRQTQNMNQVQKVSYFNQKAMKYVQSSAPCNNQAKKMKKANY